MDIVNGVCKSCGDSIIHLGERITVNAQPNIAEAEDEEYDIQDCDNCVQFTKHVQGICQKCKPSASLDNENNVWARKCEFCDTDNIDWHKSYCNRNQSITLGNKSHPNASNIKEVGKAANKKVCEHCETETEWHEPHCNRKQTIKLEGIYNTYSLEVPANNLKDIVTTIFYSPATNGKAAESIENGIRLVNEYVSSQPNEKDALLKEMGEALETYKKSLIEQAEIADTTVIIDNDYKKGHFAGTSSAYYIFSEFIDDLLSKYNNLK